MYCGNQRQIRFEPVDKRYGFVLYVYGFMSNHVRVVKEIIRSLTPMPAPRLGACIRRALIVAQQLQG